jgi:excinuclease UvrABC ATPase subunit
MSKTNFGCNTCKYTVPIIRKPDSILLHSAREHNLKNICFEIPKGKLVGLTGPSGSGKSFIASDILQKTNLVSKSLCLPKLQIVHTFL